jgi:hypothetical protein
MHRFERGLWLCATLLIATVAGVRADVAVGNGTLLTFPWTVAQGGTGSTTQNFVDLTTAQASIGGAKTFTSTLASTANINVASGGNYQIAGSQVLGGTSNLNVYPVASGGAINFVNFANTFVNAHVPDAGSGFIVDRGNLTVPTGTIQAGASIGCGTNGTPHVECGQVSATLGTCLITTLCTVGTFTFTLAYTSAPKCVVSNATATAVSAAAIPDVSAVGTTTATVSAYAVAALTGDVITININCAGA